MPATQKGYSVADLVRDLRAVVATTTDDREIVKQVMPLAKRIADQKEMRNPAFYDCDEGQGFGINILHEEPDHTLLVEAIAWLPGRGVKPHDHQTWGVVIGRRRREQSRRLFNGAKMGCS